MKTAPAVSEKCSFKKIGLMLQCPVLQKDNPGRTESPAGIQRRNVDRRRRDFPIPPACIGIVYFRFFRKNDSILSNGIAFFPPPS